MASSWGDSWGLSWGNTWGEIGAVGDVALPMFPILTTIMSNILVDILETQNG